MFLSFNRQLFTDILLNGSFSAGIAKKIDGNRDDRLRVNDAFYLNNFKGIRNLGYNFVEEEGKKVGLGGDVLGFDRYINGTLKIS